LRVTAGIDQRGKAVIADMDVWKFVDIRNPDPIGLPQNWPRLGFLERFHLVIASFGRIGQMHNMPLLCQPIQQRVRAIRTVVRIKQKIRNAQHLMIGDPFQNEWPLFLTQVIAVMRIG